MEKCVSPPRYTGLHAASRRASAAARGASKKRDTRAELLLRRALWARGLRYRVDVAKLPGRPDIVFSKGRVAVFCDGDFWHGRNIEEREKKLRAGHNPAYWVKKIRTNIERDRRWEHMLEADGWIVLRFWETDIHANVDAAAERINSVLRERCEHGR